MRPREHYLRQLEIIHAELQVLGQMVVAAITQAIDTLAQQDTELAEQVVVDDQRIDRAQYALEEHVLGVMATQQPTAGDLRRLIAAIEIAGELERIGDYAKGIAKITIRNAHRPLAKPLVDIPRMAEFAVDMLNRALIAFVEEDAAAARQLGPADDRVDVLSTRVRTELLDLMQHDPSIVEPAVDLLFVAHNMERIADRTTNIAERVIFIDSGDIVELNP